MMKLVRYNSLLRVKLDPADIIFQLAVFFGMRMFTEGNHC